MNRRETYPPIRVDIDCDRLREIVPEAIRLIHEYTNSEFLITKEQILERLEQVFKIGKIAAPFFLELGCKRYPDMVLRVDPQRKEVLCKSSYKKQAAQVNYFLRAM